MEEQSEFDWEETEEETEEEMGNLILIRLEDYEADSDIFTDYKRSLQKMLESEFDNCSETNLENCLAVEVHYKQAPPEQHHDMYKEMKDIRRKMEDIVDLVHNPYNVKYTIS